MWLEDEDTKTGKRSDAFPNMRGNVIFVKANQQDISLSRHFCAARHEGKHQEDGRECVVHCVHWVLHHALTRSAVLEHNCKIERCNFNCGETFTVLDVVLHDAIPK